MASSVTIKLQGAQGLLNKVRLLAPSIRANVKEVIAEYTLLIESDAKEFAPVDTGLLRSSIHGEIAPSGLSSTIGTDVQYALAQEFGTRYMQAHPFLGPAFEKNRQPFLADLRKAGLKLN